MTEPSAISRLIRAGLVTGVTDGLFSSVLSAFFYGSTVTRLFQGVAAVLIGTAAFDGGARTAAVGLLMHFGVAFGWSAVFLILYLSSAWIRGLATSSAGVVAIAAVYGPLVWIVMSMAIVPLFTHRPPTINIRWWVQFFGHIPFVALPIVTMISRAA
jgi:uncharacterized membrane protein YagU involved in acid resistance